MLTIDFSHINIEPGAKILDLGCGEGRHLHNLYLRENIEVIGIDLDFSSLCKTHETCKKFFPKQRKRNWLIIQGRCEYIPISDSTIDCVICSEVLEHIENYHRVIKEIKRILKPDGKLAVSIPRYMPERICWFLSKEYPMDKGGHIRIFKTSPLILEIERLGFKLYKKHFAHGLHSPYWWLKCFNWEKRDTWLPIRLYHKMLVWDILKRPKLTRVIDRILTPLIGKSVVLYFKKVG